MWLSGVRRQRDMTATVSGCAACENTALENAELRARLTDLEERMRWEQSRDVAPRRTG